ncbi:hypothetical protein ACT3XG_02560 [Paenibacillus polymyxa]|uniref:hypothetical protein n=1 Tax=Paenibacillus TaxID=44249 RepID=UPI00035C96B2|nr:MULTISPECIES: hypothetical protein [Paenibacillus]KAF6653821.1 hypothetical protein HFD99_19155 [Paenibacillus sp. EKM301P]KKD53191.1 hypothetical protein C400_19865 [Paenibacillus sp. ICGEB2008]MEE4565630.1 hypothetical protein [Paenibacillus polymyxa]QDA26472.1 hypothetical protein FGY93_05475 [Paenibacillus polymyxa]RPE10594.1 hypothetical protein EG487_02695 [Paenibacillus polymyxa]
MPSIKELEIKKWKRTEDIIVRFMGADNYTTGYRHLEGWDYNQKNIMLAGDEKGTLESIRANVIQ